MCCGQKRTALGTHPPQMKIAAASGVRPQPVVRSAPLSTAPPSSVSLRYVRQSPIRVRGGVTGRQYEFSSARPAQAVDRRDVAGLVQTGLFRQA
jgi:hypothetical protein